MRIVIATPAPPRSRKGNRVTALRWSRFLRELGHRVTIREEYTNQRCDVLIALHARRSAASVKRFAESRPEKPLILALTGTDLYRDIHRNQSAQRSLQTASRLVLLQPRGIDELPARLHSKTRVIYQSVPSFRGKVTPIRNRWEVCVCGHLRPVKDPFRAAMAARRLPDTSRIRIVHLGAALSEAMRIRAEREMQRNPRYEWLGELPRWKAQRRLARSRLVVLSSEMEGGANVISEALASGVPVVSSRISGSVGLLGEDYPGYFSVGDTDELTALLRRAEEQSSFYEALKSWCRELAPLVDPARERESWQQLLAEWE